MSGDKRAPAAPALSPIVQLLPTGYRDIQLFQRGQGWHTNGKAKRERVVFPAIASHQHAATEDATTGPTLSVVVDRYDASMREESDEPAERRAISPSVTAIPVPPPRRPGSGTHGEGNQRASSSSGSFRTRAIAASIERQNGASPTASGSENAREEEDVIPLPDAATMEKLWQEYNERTRHPTKTIDKEAYHRKMQHRYNEAKVLRERIARLEMELEDAQRERDEALEAAQRSAQQAIQRNKSRDPELDDPMSGTGISSEPVASIDEVHSQNAPPALSHRNSSSERNFASVAARVSMSHKLQQQRNALGTSNPEEISYREKATKLERTMAVTKEGVAQLQARLVAMHDNDRETIERLRAQLELEQQASKLLSVQLRETNAAFRSTADELVSTQVALDKERIEKQIVVEQIQAETRQLISDQRRRELQSRVKNVVRTLGKEALHQKMEALHTRVMTAEHHMRVAQLEVLRLKEERDKQQQRIDEILASREIKYHVLAAQDGGIPGILKRATSLYQGTRTVNDQFVLVQMLYEDRRARVDPLLEPSANPIDPPEDPEDGFCIHMLVYEAFTAQDDYLTFHLRDIKRLVPDAEKYLARFPDRKHERFLELAELLFAHCHLGYKNGHIVLTERPASQEEAADREKRELVIYRGSRFIRLTGPNAADQPEELLVDLVINEVHNPSTSQLWWLQVQATAVDFESNQEEELNLTVDSQVLKSVVGTFASYRPSESIQALQPGGPLDELDAFGIHEDLLEPLFERLEWRQSEETSSSLVLVDADGTTVLCGGTTLNDPDASIKGEDDEQQQPQDDDESEVVPTSPSVAAPRVLDHRSIVSVNDTFFCVRIEEVWDGELMLRVTMEEPADSINRYETTLHEESVSTIAAYLFKVGLCDTDHSTTIKFGLPPSLHDALCRVLKKHANPIPASSKPRSSGDVVTHRISFDTLLRDAQAQNELPPKLASAAEHQELILSETRVFGRRRVDRVTTIGNEIDEQLAYEILARAFSDEASVDRQRRRVGCRMEASLAFAMVNIYSGFSTPFQGFVVVDTQQFTTSTISEPRIVIAQRSFHETLLVLGLRAPATLPMK